MAVSVLPFTPSEGNYQFEVSIEDIAYVFDVRWNERDKAWYFDLLEADRTPIAYGLKVTVGSYIGRYSTHALFQRGVIAAIDTSGEYRDPGFDDIGDGQRVEVRYYGVADLIAENYT